MDYNIKLKNPDICKIYKQISGKSLSITIHKNNNNKYIISHQTDTNADEIIINHDDAMIHFNNNTHFNKDKLQIKKMGFEIPKHVIVHDYSGDYHDENADFIHYCPNKKSKHLLYGNKNACIVYSFLMFYPTSIINEYQLAITEMLDNSSIKKKKKIPNYVNQNIEKSLLRKVLENPTGDDLILVNKNHLRTIDLKKPVVYNKSNKNWYFLAYKKNIKVRSKQKPVNYYDLLRIYDKTTGIYTIIPVPFIDKNRLIELKSYMKYELRDNNYFRCDELSSFFEFGMCKQCSYNSCKINNINQNYKTQIYNNFKSLMNKNKINQIINQYDVFYAVNHHQNENGLEIITNIHENRHYEPFSINKYLEKHKMGYKIKKLVNHPK